MEASEVEITGWVASNVVLERFLETIRLPRAGYGCSWVTKERAEKKHTKKLL